MTAKTRIEVVGAGLMGHGIAEEFAAAGHEVKVHDPSAEALASLRERVAKVLADLGRDPEAAERVTPEETLRAAVVDADVVFEAAPEKVELKQAIFAELERLAPPAALLASNTSVIPIGRIARDVKTRDRVLGTHWWMPPYLIPLVEVVQGIPILRELVVD